MRKVPAWAALLLAVFLLYGVNLNFGRDLWVQDEARYGETVREMVESGRYLVPTLDGQFYPDKPPLYFWLLALQARLTGLGMLSFRLVTFASVLGFAAAFFVFARRLLGESRGLWAVLIALTSELFLLSGNIVRMDILLALFVVLSIDFLLRAVDHDRRELALAGYGFALLATMVKGPLGFAFPVLGAAAYALLASPAKPGWWRERLRGLVRLRLPLGLALAAAIGAVWTGYLVAAGEAAYVEDVLVKQLWGRSIRSWSHPEPFYFYLLVLLPLFMPWLPYLRRGLGAAPREVRRIALGWFVPGFVLISAVSGKLFVYLVPLFPPLALLVAAAVPAPWEDSGGQPQARAPGLICGLFFAAAGGGLLYALARLLPPDLWRLAPAGLALLALGVLLAVLALKGQTRRLLWVLLGGSCLISWLLMGWGAAQVNDYFSARRLGLRLAEAREAGFEPAAVDIARGTLSFYAGFEIRQLSHAELEAALDEPGRLVVAVRNKKRGLIPRHVLDRLAVLERFPRLEYQGYALYIERSGSDEHRLPSWWRSRGAEET